MDNDILLYTKSEHELHNAKYMYNLLTAELKNVILNKANEEYEQISMEMELYREIYYNKLIEHDNLKKTLQEKYR